MSRVMIYFWNHYSTRKQQSSLGSGAIYRTDEQGRAHVVLYSRFFSDLTGNFLCTNRMYAELKNELESSLELVGTDKRIVADIYEPSESDEENRIMALIGFKRYLETNRLLEQQKLRSRLAMFTFFMLVGFVIVLWVFEFQKDALPVWGMTCLEHVSSVFIWQFVGYMAYEYHQGKRQLRRLRQMIAAEFNFKKWD